MTTCLEFTKRLKQLDGANNPVVSSLYNYFRYYIQPGKDVDVIAIDSYFRRIYAFEFWRKETKQVQHHIKKILAELLSKEENKQIIRSLFLQEAQIVPLEHKRDWLPIIENYAKNKSIQYRILESGPQDVYIYYTWDNGNCALQKMRPFVILDHGIAKPITCDEMLYFDKDFKPLTFQPQHIQIGDYLYARFERSLKSYEFQTFKGYSLQASERSKFDSLDQNAKIYYSVKKLEGLITGKEDNSMYQDLCDLLEKSLDLLKSNHPESVKLAFVALERGKNAYQTTFPNDKLLNVLVKELSYHLDNKFKGNEAHANTTQ